MEVIPTEIPGVLVFKPKVFGDDRGFFMESFNRKTWISATGVDCDFVQDNHSRSRRGVLRGLHYQIRHPQGKLVRVLSWYDNETGYSHRMVDLAAMVGAQL